MIKSLIVGLFLLIIGLSAPVMAATDTSTTGKFFSGCKYAPDSTICKTPNTKTNPVNRLIKVAASIVALLTGVAAVIFIILGGLTMVTSAGNPEAVANARKRILASVIGLVIVALAWTAIAFVTDRFIK